MKKAMLIVIGSFIGIALSAQVNNIASKVFSLVKNGTSLTIPYESSQAIETTDPGIKYLVFSIHGANRDADNYYDRMISAKNIAGEDGDSTLIIAPQFLTEPDIDAFSLGSTYLYWSSGGWIAGSNSRNESANPRSERIPSYEVIDSIILRIVAAIPTIEHITLVGHSAGAQVVHRMAISSPIAEEDAIDQRVRFIVANPSSYVYLDDKRRVEGTTDQFTKPSTNCSDYNEWKYGLDDLFTYPGRTGASIIRNNYKDAEVIYLLGGADNDPNSSSLDTDCAAQLQGAHRLERGTIYYNHLKDYYGEQVHQIDTVPGVGHSSTDMFASDKGVFHIFEVLGSKKTSTSVRAYVNNIGSLSVSPNPTNGWIDIISPSTKSKIVQYRMYDMTGRLQLSITNRKDSQRIDISNLPQGIYLVQANLGNEIYQEKVLRL